MSDVDIERSESRERHLEKAPKEELVDLYDITVWEPRTFFDRLCELPFRVLSKNVVRCVMFVVAALIILSSTALAMVREPIVGGFVLVSVVPAFFLLSYLWISNPYESTTFLTVVVTYLLGCMVVSVAAFVNSAGRQAFLDHPALGIYLFFFLVVAPVEELLKMLAVVLYGYDWISNAVAGAVLGAVAGLGFGTVENFLYLSDVFSFGFASLTESSFVRAGTSVGHVFWSAVAGYYIGLAKIVPENRGPVLLKGFLITVVLHATYNSIMVAFFGAGAGIGLEIPVQISLGEHTETAQIMFLLVFYAGIGYYLFTKIDRHRDKIDSIPVVSA